MKSMCYIARCNSSLTATFLKKDVLGRLFLYLKFSESNYNVTPFKAWRDSSHINSLFLNT